MKIVLEFPAGDEGNALGTIAWYTVEALTVAEAASAELKPEGLLGDALGAIGEVFKAIQDITAPPSADLGRPDYFDLQGKIEELRKDIGQVDHNAWRRCENLQGGIISIILGRLEKLEKIIAPLVS